MAFDTILIANRGEIACRVIRSAKSLGLRTVAVFSEADRDAPHAALADEAICIGPGPAGKSYLDPARILDAAARTGARAIHPGYGFLSENAEFAEAVAAAGLVFIGPPAGAIRVMGDKAEAKRLMQAASVPCVPGYDGEDQSDAALIAAADTVGFPIMVKATAGGGGRGMRLVETADALPGAIARARSEAENAFGSGQLILERAIQRPRHVEIQVMADRHGNTIHLGERDCSVQRRHQKIVEEAPCPVMTPDLRARMGEAAVAAARAVDYVGAGTVEFLLEEGGAFHFLEMNTRLQVEHPVTEMVTGLDLVALQIGVAQGHELPLTQDDVRISGHAIEVRLYAEDPAQDFLPATGRIVHWQPAQGLGLRVDDGIASGQEVSPYYDPMLAKIIAHGDTRDAALRRLRQAVEASVLLGPATNSEFLHRVLRHPEFEAGKATTAFLSDAFPDGHSPESPGAAAIALAAALMMVTRRDAALVLSGHVATDQLHWSSAPLLPRDVAVIVGGETIDTRVLATESGWQIDVMGQTLAVGEIERSGPNIRARIGDARRTATAIEDGDTLWLATGAARYRVDFPGAGRSDEDDTNGNRVTAPMPGLVLSLSVAPGDRVAKGDTLAVLEAMKMQHRIDARLAGRVAEVHVAEGQQIASGTVMIEIEEET